MHIKSLTIQGFKSYRDQTTVDPFSPSVNVVVGRNGSGKSNFFSAIRFVLSDAYTSLSRQERQALLHEGSSTNTTFSAYVEIVFDNSDNRFPTNNNEVVLRRTIGAKKDEYSLDRKTTNKGEVMSLLESAGFSRSNPYYIVPQGRITTLTNQKDSDRLELLKEVAGTIVYENRRQESMKIIQETEVKRAKVEETLELINDRLAELDEEKADLKAFQEADRTRRSLEYAIYSRELAAASETLQTIEQERADDADAANAARADSQARERQINRVEMGISETKQALSLLDLERKQAETDRRETVKARTQLECTITDLEAARSSASDLKDSLEADLAAVRTSISDTETSLMEVTAQWEDASKTERDERETLEGKSARCDALFSKQGRTQRFATQADRDRFLESEIGKLRSFVGARENREREVSRELQNATGTLAETVEKVSKLRGELDGRAEAMQQAKAGVEGLRSQMNEAIEQRKSLWKEDSKLDQTVQHARHELQNAERGLMTTMDKGTSNGLRSAKRIAGELELDGYYGPLYELFTIPDYYRTAAEVTAGSSLFHIVVDNDATASQLMEAMAQQKGGRATFMPLSRLRVKPVTYPTYDANVMDDDERVVPLIEKINCTNKQRDEKAFQQVFGRTVVCKQLQHGKAYVRSHGLSVITSEGDRIDRKGALTGGFHDIRRSRLDAIERTKLWTNKYDTEHRRHQEVKRKIVELDQTITRLTGQVSIAETKMRQAKDARASYASEALDLQRDEQQQTGRRDRLQRESEEMTADLKRLRAQVDALVQEKATPLTNSLSNAEASELERLTSEVAKHKEALGDLTRSRAEVESRKSMLEIELSENLRRRREELEGRIDRIGEESTGIDGETMATDTLDARQAELRSLEADIEQVAQRIDELENEAEKSRTKIQNFETELDKLQSAQAEDGKSIAKQQKAVERYHARRRVAQQRKDDCNSKIRELGVLPEEAFSKYTATKIEKLFKELHKANETLKQYSHVNKKAFEQYNSFTRQREELNARQEELDKSHESIQELIDSLDQRKDEAIERTFRQVSRYFSEVFEKIVPAGYGQLIMQKHVDEEMDADDDDEEETPRRKKKKDFVEHWTGVSIRVSFNSKTDEGLRIQQLSGGQKSVVALAIVFAIQKCDPAPFYLFDEIDANLDADRRTAIASMISELAENAQFIVTTFRPEMLVAADHHLGVIFDKRKISTIKALTADEAREFVDAAAAGAGA